MAMYMSYNTIMEEAAMLKVVLETVIDNSYSINISMLIVQGKKKSNNNNCSSERSMKKSLKLNNLRQIHKPSL